MIARQRFTKCPASSEGQTPRFVQCFAPRVIFGVLLMAQPGAGALALAWLIGTYAVIFGVILVILAFKVHRFAKHVEQPVVQP